MRVPNVPTDVIACPACGETVQQVASATLSLALWQHWNWTCKFRQALASQPEGWQPIASACRICQRHTHAKWHDLAINEVNPVALIQFVESVLPPDSASKIVGYVARVTGIDLEAMRAVLAGER
jgi:hypothetical protein